MPDASDTEVDSFLKGRNAPAHDRVRCRPFEVPVWHLKRSVFEQTGKDLWPPIAIYDVDRKTSKIIYLWH